MARVNLALSFELPGSIVSGQLYLEIVGSERHRRKDCDVVAFMRLTVGGMRIAHRLHKRSTMGCLRISIVHLSSTYHPTLSCD